VYGWVLDAGARLEASGRGLFAETWRVLADHAGFVAEHSPERDSGIWEVRDTPCHYVHSKVMAWVALDRAITLARTHRARPRVVQRWHEARDAIRSELGTAGDLIYRYQPGTDGLAGGEAAFLPCSFWVAHALARAGRAEEAAGRLESLVARGGDLGLFPEEVDPSTGGALGNYPQALSHSSFVRAALALRPDHGGADHGASNSPSAAP